MCVTEACSRLTLAVYTGVWPYFLKAIAWARKYGLRIQLDYQCVTPFSTRLTLQRRTWLAERSAALYVDRADRPGWNHSGRLGSINWLRGPMGFANAQRSLNHLRILMEFISQPQYSNVVAEITLMNEPRGASIVQLPP